MSIHLKLLAELAAALGLAQAGAWAVAKGLGRRLELPAMALGVALPLLVLSPWVATSRLLVPSDLLRRLVPNAPSVPASDRHELLNDAVFQFIPWELEVRHAFHDRRLPLWSDALEGGSSPWGNPQAGVLSPIAMLARLFPIQHFLLGMLAVKILLAAEGTWLLARGVGASRRAAALAAAGFALSGGIMAWALFPVSTALAWLPWLAIGTITLVRRGGSRRLATVALLTAALLLSGHPETAAISGLFAAACGMALAASRSRMAGLAAAAVAALLGLGLAAPHVLPFLDQLRSSQRAEETLAQAMPSHFVDVRQPATWFVPGYAAFVLSPTNPRVFGRPYHEAFRGPFNWVDAESGYAGLVAFAGSLVALAAVRRRRIWPFLGFALASLLLAAQCLPLAHVIYAVPALRAPAYSRFLPVACLAFAVAGALGIDRLLSRRGGRLVPFLALAAAAAVSLTQNAEPWVLALWSLLAAAALVGARWPRLGAAGLALVLLLDLVPWGNGFLPAGHPSLFYPPSPFLDSLRRETAEGGPWRAVGEDQTLFPSLLPVYGIEELRPHNPLAPVPYLAVLRDAFGFVPSRGRYFPEFHGLDNPLLDFLNVRAVAWTTADPVPPWFERVDDGGAPPFRLYRNPRALPRWFVPAAVDSIRRGDLARWLAALDDGRRVAVFSSGKAPVGEWARQPPPREASVTALAVRPGRIVLAVATPRPALVATSLHSPEGWHASSAGRALPMVVVDGAFFGFVVPAAQRGAAQVELRYVPPGLVAGAWLGALSLLVCGALFVRGGRPRRGRTAVLRSPPEEEREAVS